MADQAVSRGKAAARGKGEWWSNAHDVHGVEVEGPYVNGDPFVVRFKMDITFARRPARAKPWTNRLPAFYTIAGGKIAEASFFYAM